MTSLNPVMRIGHQIAEPLRLHLGLDRAEARATALSLLGQVGIPTPEDRYRAYPGQLSGGMRQRVVIAIAIACAPRLLLADEPTTGLDATVQAQILDLLASLQAERRMAMILVTHDLGRGGHPHRRDRGHVRRPDRRARPDPDAVRLDGHALHRGAARLHPAPGQPGPHPPGGHRGPAPRPDLFATGLPVRPRAAATPGTSAGPRPLPWWPTPTPTTSSPAGSPSATGWARRRPPRARPGDVAPASWTPAARDGRRPAPRRAGPAGRVQAGPPHAPGGLGGDLQHRSGARPWAWSASRAAASRPRGGPWSRWSGRPRARSSSTAPS